MKQYLLFQLYGSMASWGDTAIGGTRPSYRYPTKSAMMGLLAAALGIERNEEGKLLALQENLGFAVRIDSEGMLLTDYHTTQVPSRSDLKKRPHFTRRDELQFSSHELNTILSTRDYYCDALYTVVLWQNTVETKFTLEKIKEALLHPHFVLYLGRKSCPLSFPLMPFVSLACEKLEEALQLFDNNVQVKDNLPQKLLNKATKHRLYFENTLPEQLPKADQTHRRKDKLISRQHWQYQDRVEAYTLLNKSGEKHVL
jgi:CRISPR system Cascade subunit CasD